MLHIQSLDKNKMFMLKLIVDKFFKLILKLKLLANKLAIYSGIIKANTDPNNEKLLNNFITAIIENDLYLVIDSILNNPNQNIVNATVGADLWSPLHFAALLNRVEIIEYLIFYSANPNQSNIAGNTPMHLAAQIGLSEAIKVLLSHQANPYLVNLSGLSSIEVAKQYGFDNIASQMMQPIDNNLERLKKSKLRIRSTNTSRNQQEDPEYTKDLVIYSYDLNKQIKLEAASQIVNPAANSSNSISSKLRPI